MMLSLKRKLPYLCVQDQADCSVGCTLVPHNEWPSAPVDTPIIGLKELPEST
jgi:saccharopine dehydrogenase (NAD+, L-lysine-forming)